MHATATAPRLSPIPDRLGGLTFSEYKKEQARIARSRMYPVTVFYLGYAAIVLFFGLRSAHPIPAALFFAAGLPVWTLVEYLFHRFVLHGRFPAGQGIVRKFLHERLDPLHWEHHERPMDGWHISGELKDILPLFVIAAPVSFLAPVYTLPALLAGVVSCYVGEEWLHYAIHFHQSRVPVFRALKRYHLYHHSPKGEKLGFGITSGVWDFAFGTQYPEKIRQSLRANVSSSARFERQA